MLICSPVQSRPARPRDSADPSLNSESKIDEIARKLDRISMAVDSISTRPSLSSYTTTPQPSSALTPSSEHDSSSELEGDLSLNAHAAFATDYVQRAVTGTANVSHEVTSGLVALRAALDSRTSSQEPSQDSSVPITQLIDPQATVNGISLPALDLTMAYLQKLKGKSFLAWKIDGRKGITGRQVGSSADPLPSVRTDHVFLVLQS